MRKFLFTAVAVAPLMLLAFEGEAQAATTISNDVTTPVKTSTAGANGTPDDLTIASGGSVKVTSGTAVTVDSNNTFTNNGTVGLNGVNDSVGVLVITPHTGAVSNTGTISNVEDYTPTDTNNDGVPDGAYAQGSNRYGIRVTGDGPFTGAFTNSGSVTVEGNNSYGISLESPMVGAVTQSGAVSITGNNSTGLRMTGPVTGKVLISGGVSATGGGSKAVDISGDISGSLGIYSVLQSTGYRITTRPSDPTVRAGLLPEDLQQAGSAVTIGGSVAGGVFIGSPPSVDTTATGADTQDNDKDGIPDINEGTGSITTYGSAPALLIGADGKAITLGEFGTAENAYGLIVRGTVEGDGVFDNVNGNAMQIGTGAGTVNIEGGVRVVGGVRSTAISGDATAMHLLSGASTPTLVNENAVSAIIASEEASTATAVKVDAGATLTSITNSGAIAAKASGDTANAIAIVDKSGTLTSITNTGGISATTVSTTAGGTPTGKTVAVDVSANTSGFTFTQNAVAATTAVPNPVQPTVTGDILMGSGNDTVSLNGGAVVGAMSFGDGANTFSITNGAGYQGALTSTGTLSLDVAKGTLDNRSSSTVAMTSLHVGEAGTVYFSTDPAAGKATFFNVAGNATLDAGAKIGVTITSLPQNEQTFTVIKAGHLSVGTSDANLLASTPYLFVTTAHTDADAGTLDLTLRRRTASEAGFNRSEAAAYDSIYANLSNDTGILSAVVNQTTESGLKGVYDQLLPDHAGGVTRALSWANEAAGKAAADWPRGDNSPGPTRGWTQEIGLGEQKDAGDASAWRIYGFGAVGGLESMSPNGSALGFMTGFNTARVSNPDTPGDDQVSVQQLTLGAYWRGVYRGLHADVQGGAGYVWGHTKRELVYQNGSDVTHRLAEGDFNGYSISGRAGLAYEWKSGGLVITPQTHLDYYRLMQGGYTEHGSSDAFNIDLDSRTSDVLALTSTVVIGYTFGQRTHIRPELEVGWRQVLAGSAGETNGSFETGGLPFSLLGEDMTGGGPVGRIGLRAYNDWVDLKLDAGGEWRDDYIDLDVRASARVVF